MDSLVVDLLRKTFGGRRVLVTGHTGFKGSWLSEWLLALGADVHGYALAPVRENDHFTLLGLASRMHHTVGDIRDHAAVQEAFAKASPEFVFHLAAQPIVRASYDDPKYTFDTNVGGSVNVLEAVRGTPSVRSFVYVTSDKCYRNKEWTWGYRETDELGGRDPYSASKAAAEVVFSSYCDSFFQARPGFGAASVRAGNVIGGGDWSADRIVPDSMRALIAGGPIIVRNPGSTRPWQHVLDPLSGYLLLAARLAESPKAFGGAWNFGPSVEDVRDVGSLVQQVIKSWGSGSIESRPDPKGPHEAGLLVLSCDKARRELHWKGAWGFERAVSETCAWYKRLNAGEPAQRVTSQQIRSFEESST